MNNLTPETAPGRATPQQWPRSLTQQIRYGLPVFVVLSLLITSGVLISLSSQGQRQQLVALQRERSRAAAVAIEAYLDDISRKLSYLARVRGLADMPPELQQRLLDALTRHNAAYELVALADASGQVTAAVAPFGAAPPTQLGATPAFASAFGRQEDFIGPVEVDPESGLPVVAFAMPVRDVRDQVAGVLLARVSLEFLWFVVGETRVGEKGYAYVIDNRNVVIAEPGSTRETFQLIDLSARPFVRPLTAPDAAESLTYTGLLGEEVLGTSTRIRSVNWYMVAELPTAEVYAPQRRLLLVLGAALGVALLLAVAAGAIFARRIVAPLRELTRAAARISGGELDLQVAVQTRNELGLLAATFNGMVRRLQALIEDHRASERRFRAIFDQTFQFVALLAPDGRLLEANRSGLDFGGVAAQDVIGRLFWETPWWRASPEAVEQLRAAVALAAAGEFVRYEVEARGGDGSLATIDFSLKPVLDESGRVALLIAESRNVTDRKAKEQAERQLIAEQAARSEAELAREQMSLLAEEAQQALRVRNEFLSIASHELRTPLTSLLGNAQLLQRRADRGEPFGDRDRRYVKIIGDQALRLSRLIDALLDIARLERGVLSLQCERLELRELVERMLLELQPALREHSLAWNLGERPLYVEADALRMEQVLQNLLSNAVKYSPEGGAITVQAEVRDEVAYISISDQGIGIAPKALTQLFRRFYRAPNAEGGNIAGMGIGLYLVKEIMSLHGGDIAVQSVEGEGSIFTLSLPLYVDGASANLGAGTVDRARRPALP